MNSEGRNRKSIRLPGYDYSSPGTYFVTICVNGRQPLFGEIVEQVFVPAEAGLMIESWWNAIPGRSGNILLDSHVVMPNHFHGLIVLDIDEGEHGGLPLPDHEEALTATVSLGRIVQWFKSITMADYRRGVADFEYQPFDSRLWQRNYCEHIVRNQDDLDRIRAYIEANVLRSDEDNENPKRDTSQRL